MNPRALKIEADVRLTANVSLPDNARKATVAAGKLSAPGEMLSGKQLSILHSYIR